MPPTPESNTAMKSSLRFMVSPAFGSFLHSNRILGLLQQKSAPQGAF
jgi:hypothetical protein